MLKTVWEWVVNTLFGVKTQTSKSDIAANEAYAEAYKVIDDINFAAIFGNKLANYVVNDSAIDILGDTKRSEALNEIGHKMWKKIKKPVAICFGIGGVVIVPSVKNGKIYYDFIDQSRMTIDAMDGEVITGATLLAEVKEVTNLSTTTTYYRWVNYKVENNNLIMTTSYSNNMGQEVEAPSFWEDIIPQIAITNMDRAAFGFIKSPMNNRDFEDKYGVPVTFGTARTVTEIKQTLKQIAKEFGLKQAMILVDKKFFRGDNKLPSSGLFKKGDTGQDDFYQEFSPEIRYSPHYERLQELYERLEKEVGTNAGVMSKGKTEVYTNNAEVKRNNFDTFSIVDDMRTNVEQGMIDFFYACDVLMNAFNITPSGEYTIDHKWDKTLLEDSREQLDKLVIGNDKGVVSKAELRNHIKSNETMDESEEAVKNIKEQDPSVKDLVGIA